MRGNLRSNIPALLAVVFASLFMIMCSSNEQGGGKSESNSDGTKPAAQKQPEKTQEPAKPAQQTEPVKPAEEKPPVKPADPAVENPPDKPVEPAPADPKPPAEPAKPAEKSAIEISFEKSLHRTGEGMRYWYEKNDGFMSVTGMPYAQLDCSSCHADACDKCHGPVKQGEKPGKVAMDTCLKCHTRAKSTMDTDKKAECVDVHFNAAMECTDCHKNSQMHGDGTARTSTRSPDNPRIECMDCHKKDGEAPEYNSTSRSHAKHSDDLACNACHVRSTMSCYNCHFDTFLETKSRKGTFIPSRDSLLLVNYKGKVTSGIAMSLIHKGKPFVAYAPYFTHSVLKKGRSCEDCHKNEAVEMMKKGQKVPLLSSDGGKPVPWKGVVPLVKGLVTLSFFEKKPEGWVPAAEAPIAEQYASFAEPLTESQLKKMGMPAKSK